MIEINSNYLLITTIRIVLNMYTGNLK